MSKEYPLNVPAPHHYTFAVRDIPNVTVEQRERALKATHYNEFAFPAGMLTVDMLSDSGTTAMTNQQWASLFLGDEAYGRNTGYYVLLDTFRDIFERGGEKNWKKSIDLVRTDCRDVEKMMDELYLCEYEGGLFNDPKLLKSSPAKVPFLPPSNLVFFHNYPVRMAQNKYVSYSSASRYF